MASHGVGWWKRSVFSIAFSSSNTTIVGASGTFSIVMVCSRASITARATMSPFEVPTRTARGARKTAGVVYRTPLASGSVVSVWVCRTVSVSARPEESYAEATWNSGWPAWYIHCDQNQGRLSPVASSTACRRSSVVALP